MQLSRHFSNKPSLTLACTLVLQLSSPLLAQTADRIKVRGRSTHADPQLESTLLDYLEGARFRPEIDSDGKTAMREVLLRYHFAIAGAT